LQDRGGPRRPHRPPNRKATWIRPETRSARCAHHSIPNVACMAAAWSPRTARRPPSERPARHRRRARDGADRRHICRPV